MILTFPFNLEFITFFLYYFFNCKFILICFLQFVFAKYFNKVFSIKIINEICLRYSIFNFFNHKNLFRPIWSVNFAKATLYFDILKLSQILSLRFLLLTFLLESINVFDLRSSGVALDVVWYVLLCLLTISSNLSIYTFFETEVIY